MAEKFCSNFGGGPHHLKIGKSFEKKGGNSVFHSIRYDFTPLSVDEDRMGKLEVQENSGVSVSLPHNNGIDATQYKGGAKPAGTKDCILIIDHETGELTLERLSNQILLKKTRAEKAEKHHGGGEGSSSSSNPYLVKQEPEKPATSSYTVKREPDKPHGPRAPRPSTPQHKHKAAAAPASTGSPGHGVSSRGSPGAGAAARLPHSRGLSESSDSNSSSSSDSDSDSDSNASANEKNCQLAAAMEATANTASSFSMPGDVSDLFLPGGGGHLPTSRPQKPHKKPEKQKQKGSPPSRPESESKVSAGAGGGSGSSMPNLFTDLGDDLQLTDESDD